MVQLNSEADEVEQCHQRLCGRDKLYMIFLELEYSLNVNACQYCINALNVPCTLIRELRFCISSMGVPSPFTRWNRIPMQIYNNPTPSLYYLLRFLFDLLTRLEENLTWTWDGFHVLCQVLDSLEFNIALVRPYGTIPLNR